MIGDSQSNMRVSQMPHAGEPKFIMDRKDSILINNESVPARRTNGGRRWTAFCRVLGGLITKTKQVLTAVLCPYDGTLDIAAEAGQRRLGLGQVGDTQDHIS